MKNILKITLILLISLPLNGFGQALKNVERQKELSFLVSSEKSESKGNSYNLIVTADRKAIKNAERVYIRIIDPKTEENLYVKTIDKDALKGEKAVTDESIKTVTTNSDEMLMIFGPFKKGEYVVYIKIKDDKDNVYFDRQRVTL